MNPHLVIQAQPDDTTCGPTCLHAIYRYYGDDLPLEQVIKETGALEGGGTLGVMLGCHALARGYRVHLYTYNLHVFDPSWFENGPRDLAPRLRAQADAKDDAKLRNATDYYIRFLGSGGAVRFEDLRPSLLRRYLKKEVPILTGLSATYLYHSPREREFVDDDIGGEPVGHFVILSGYDAATRKVNVADPYRPNPISPAPVYSLPIERVQGAILLGMITYDANFLIIRPA